jgi:16S rRNA (cytidine1402-2'-O)-methyltransferase
MEGCDKKEAELKRQMEYESISIEEHIKRYMDEGMDKKDAVKKVAKERSLSKSEVYKYSIDM